MKLHRGVGRNATGVGRCTAEANTIRTSNSRVRDVGLRAYLRFVGRRHLRQTGHRNLQWIQDGLIFVHIPKNAGSAIAAAFGRDDPGHHRLSESLKHATGGEVVFAVVRDPVSRLVSTWRYAHSPGIRAHLSSPLAVLRSYESLDSLVRSAQFEILCRNFYFMLPQHEYLRGYRSVNIELLRFESIEADFSRRFGIDLPRVNVTRNAGYTVSSELSVSAKSKIASMYGADYTLCRLAESQHLDS